MDLKRREGATICQDSKCLGCSLPIRPACDLSWVEATGQMGCQKWVGVPVFMAWLTLRLIFDIRVIALGYEDEFGKCRRVVQHALYV